LPSGANPLGSASFTVQLVGGKTNDLNVALQGIIAYINFSNASLQTDSYSFPAGSAGSQPLTLQAVDADSNTIVAGTQTVTNGSQTETDTFANPIKITVTDTGGFTKLSKNGGAPAASVALDASSDSVVLEYSAGTPAGYSATITASSASARYPAYTILAALSATLSAQTLTADGPAATRSAIEAQPQDGAVYFTITQPNAGTSACPTDALAFTQTRLYVGTYSPAELVAAYAPGNCTAQVSDGSASISFNVTIAPGKPQPPRYLVAAYSANYMPTNSQIVRYRASYPGNTSSFSTPSNDVVDGIAADKTGDVYVSTTRSAGTFALEKYAAGTTGAATPEASIAVSDPIGVGEVAIDGSGNVYVTLIGNAEVAEYTSSLSTQVATLGGQNTGLSPGISGSLAADASGNLRRHRAGHWRCRRPKYRYRGVRAARNREQ
jgi:hypothetical protein